VCRDSPRDHFNDEEEEERDQHWVIEEQEEPNITFGVVLKDMCTQAKNDKRVARMLKTMKTHKKDMHASRRKMREIWENTISPSLHLVDEKVAKFNAKMQAKMDAFEEKERKDANREMASSWDEHDEARELFDKKRLQYVAAKKRIWKKSSLSDGLSFPFHYIPRRRRSRNRRAPRVPVTRVLSSRAHTRAFN
jgi:hypothetical protein